MHSYAVFLFTFVNVFLHSYGYVAYDELYADGLEAYWNENWPACVKYLEDALESYRFSRQGVAKCSRECKAPMEYSPISTNMKFILDKAMCMEKCERDLFGDSRSILRISDDIKNDFKNRVLYKYLQFAYFRNGDFAKSLEVTYTYVLYDPDDAMMKKNMEFYYGHENSTSDMYINRDVKLHLRYHDNGVSAYNREDYAKAIDLFERALVEFYKAEEECRAICEGEHNVGEAYPNTPPTFFQQIINHYRDVLECAMACHVELARTSKNHVYENYLPKHYSYLQVAYNKVNKVEESLKCAKTYLLFHPDNKTMEEFLFLSRSTGSVISAQQEAVEIQKRIEIQTELLKYIYQNFGVYNFDPSLLTPYKQEAVEEGNERQQDAPVNSPKGVKTDTRPPEEENVPSKGDTYDSGKQKTNDIIDSKDQHNQRMEQLRKKRDAENSKSPQSDVDISGLKDKPIGRHTVDSNTIITIGDANTVPKPIAEGPLIYESAILLANSTQMLGPTRFAMDGFATDTECQELIDLELAGGVSGDGYQGLASPHTRHEVFEGLTVLRAVELAEQGNLPLRSAQLYFDLSERVRVEVKSYFKLKELYFDYTHLVCRIATGMPGERMDLSHPVHGDNCILKQDGSCVKAAPAYTWRDYSSIMYLNDEFDGGEFIMTDATARRVKLQVKPKCGRLVSFCAGKECLHGVKPVTRGRRCAMALWFTQDPTRDEELRMDAMKKLDRLQKKDEL